MPKDPRNALLVSRLDVHAGLSVFGVKLKEGPPPAFLPGQYATLGIENAAGKLVRRAYSVASAPGAAYDADGVLHFYVVKVDGGALTPSLFDLRVGDELFLSPRLGGHFVLGPGDPDRDLVMVATGTGTAPFRSMLRAEAALPPAERTGRRRVLIEGCRVAEDLGFFDELNALAAADPAFVYLPTVTREPDSSAWSGRRGRVNALLKPDAFLAAAGFPLDPASTAVFLCGNPQMIDQAEEELTDRGFRVRDRKNPDGNVVFERYW
ncbi:ferredoxin--NADP reductase [Phycisphaera mikurensis]|uniref:ferredoxin--NADP(+) reductase n=1 Tax=Phycisphaera mikurensis (strain NBRC 102666 / KCTC 22515 / FYK2301M01) TaxID=1142394 RepID=I0IF34_PHYMF|nr:ferredoxin--NADP reductase [Phycisphaera mikurensis]MBB6440732.1 ferredoxin--NADP+ reductase [Phycisphaera mikurensis]BAM03872.1 putative ferredoxin--NADP reductase [Phycisphaera mikurensis NBRC 102666]